MSWHARPGGWPVFPQTLLLLLFALLITQAIGLGMLFALPVPRPDFNRLSDVSAMLGGVPESDHVLREEREKELRVRMAPVAPVQPRTLGADPALTHDLAVRLGRPDGAVRLYFQPERRPEWTDGQRRRWAQLRHREPIFFGHLLAAVQTPSGWRIAETPPPPIISAWQRRLMAWFALVALALVPLAWAFARALSRPIRRFADAADRLGTDPNAPAVAEAGPAELRVAARALNRMQGRLAEYVSERTAMIGAIAHDLRTPLARVAFRVEGVPDPVREKVLADVDQMQAMISATMGFVRGTGQPGERTTMDLAGLIGALVEQDRDLDRAVSAGMLEPAMVRGDPLALERLVQNLIDNGVAYAGAVEVTLTREASEARVVVADRGPGLPAELLDRVFQPFARGDPSRNRETGGVGLGLTIARSIAEDHGGRLTLAARAGGGLQALLRLPLST